MEQWVTDKFYSHFPSYSGEKSRRKLLDKDRQDEYNLFLSRLSSADNASKQVRTERDEQYVASNRSNEVLSKQSSNELSKRDVSLWNENMDLPGVFNEEIIKKRNRRVEEERHYKNLQYQRELLKQIEEKRKEAEERKAKEIKADELLTKKVEAQLRSVRLQDEIEKAAIARKRENRNRQSDLALSPKQNKCQIPISSRSTNKSPRQQTHSGRSKELKSGKENKTNKTNKVDDAEIYKYFTNSARDSIDMRNINLRSHPDIGHEENMSSTMDSHRCHTYPAKKNRSSDANQRCARCESVMHREVCNFCQQNRFLARSQYENCAAHDRHPPLCKSCYYQSICACCRGEICVRCNRPTKLDDHLRKSKTDPVAKQSPHRRKLSPKAINLALLEESYEDSSDEEPNYIHRTSSRMSSPRKTQLDGKPYSFNIDESSMFHPSNAGVEAQTIASLNGDAKHSNDALKRMTDEKVLKYAKNYGDMHARNTARSKMIDMDPYPLPLLAEQSLIRKSLDSDAGGSDGSGGNSFAFRELESRWQIPFTQKNTIVAADNDKRVYTLTQSGAFKKQLQMDKFNFGFDRSDDENHL